MMALVGLILVIENMYMETFPTVHMKSVWISVSAWVSLNIQQPEKQESDLNQVTRFL